jgi:hypothetical protein
LAEHQHLALLALSALAFAAGLIAARARLALAWLLAALTALAFLLAAFAALPARSSYADRHAAFLIATARAQREATHARALSTTLLPVLSFLLPALAALALIALLLRFTKCFTKSLELARELLHLLGALLLARVLLHLLGRALHRFAAAFARTPVLLLHPIRGITQLATQLIELTLHVSSRLVLATELVELTLPLLEEALLFLGRLFAALFALAASFEEPFFLFLRVLELALARAALAVFGHRAQILDQLARRSLLACPSRELLHLARGLVGALQIQKAAVREEAGQGSIAGIGIKENKGLIEFDKPVRQIDEKK